MSYMKSEWTVSEQDGPHTGEVLRCWGSIERTCRERMSQANIKPVYYYSVAVAHIMSLHAAAAELGRNLVSKHQIQSEYGHEQADAGRDCRTRLARPNSQARTRTGKYQFSLFS